MAKTNKVRQNFHVESENALNEQINLELNACYIYQSMSMYFDREDVSLPGFSKFFNEMSKQQRDHSEKLMKYLNIRGGRILLKEIKKPELDEWNNGLRALEIALDIEKTQNASLLSMHKVPSERVDPQMTNFLEEEFLDEQVKIIRNLAHMITKLKRAGSEGLGEYLFDQELVSLNSF